jgi:hypothetical protein
MRPETLQRLGDLAKYVLNLETSNKSLDASGISGSLNDNLRLAPLLPAASTPPLDGFADEHSRHKEKG